MPSYINPGEPVLLINPDAIFFSVQKPNYESEVNLLLLPKEKDSKEPGWSFKQGKQVEMNRKGGEYYYIGCSTMNVSAIQHLDPNAFSELGPLWHEMSLEKRVSGQKFEGIFIPVGNRMEFEKVKDMQVLPLTLNKEFAEFKDFTSLE